MRLYELLRENVSTDASLKIIIDILTTELPGIYRTLSRLAENYFDSHGELGKGYRFISGGAKSKWYHDIFFKQLKPALYKLLENLPRNSKIELKEFLSSMTEEGSFNRIQNELIRILDNISKDITNQKLSSAVSSARHTIRNYESYLLKLESDEDEPISKSPKAPNVIGQQNTSVEQIINDVLSRIDRNQAGEIRNILARSDNKLATLQRELASRGIHP
jgi:hypothetical protein